MSEDVIPRTRTITDILLDAGVVTRGQIDGGLRRQKELGVRIGEALVEMGVVSESDIGWALARQLGMPFIDLVPETLDRRLITSFSEGMLRRVLALPLVRDDESISVAFGDPTDADAIAELERAAGSPVSPSIAAPSAIRSMLDRIARERAVAGARGAAAELRPHHTLEYERSGAQALNSHLGRAVAAGASEIHFLPAAGGVDVHHRIAGRLVPAGTEPETVVYFLLARLEALGGPAFDGEQLHAFGRAVCPAGDREVPLDVSLLNAEGGLAIRLGLNPPAGPAPALDEIGLDPVDLARLRGVAAHPAGIVLISGPARSGCSTTLASLLAEVPSGPRRCIEFSCRSGRSIPAGTRVRLDPEHACERWAEIAVAQNADVVALDDVLTGAAINGVLSSAGSGRLLLATTDWCDSFALIDHLRRRPGDAAALASRLHVVIQQRMPRVGPMGAAPARPIFELLFVSDAMREAFRSGNKPADLRELARAEGQRMLADEIHARVAAAELSAGEAARLLT